jgi:hypothetical protein
VSFVYKFPHALTITDSSPYMSKVVAFAWRTSLGLPLLKKSILFRTVVDVFCGSTLCPFNMSASKSRNALKRRQPFPLRKLAIALEMLRTSERRDFLPKAYVPASESLQEIYLGLRVVIQCEAERSEESIAIHFYTYIYSAQRTIGDGK